MPQKKKIIMLNVCYHSFNTQDIDWKNLDKQVNRALPGLKREWGKLAERVKKDPEWVRFQWLSMKTGKSEFKAEMSTILGSI